MLRTKFKAIVVTCVTAIQNTATAGLTAVTAGITGVQGTATNAITALTPHNQNRSFK